MQNVEVLLKIESKMIVKEKEPDRDTAATLSNQAVAETRTYHTMNSVRTLASKVGPIATRRAMSVSRTLGFKELWGAPEVSRKRKIVCRLGSLG